MTPAIDAQIRRVRLAAHGTKRAHARRLVRMVAAKLAREGAAVRRWKRDNA